jgi:uncharacterized membrane protein YphA (DoxX/SURF4 family)
MQLPIKLTPRWQWRLATGLCWFIAVEFFFFAPFKFSPVGVLGYPSYFVKFVQWGYPAWFSVVVGACELVAAALLTLPRRRFLGAVILVALMTGAVTTHIVDHNTLADSIAAPASIAALTQWPADWRDPLTFSRRKPRSMLSAPQHS